MYKHGFRKHVLYNTWKGMIARCYNKNHAEYKYWGGRGIIVCDEWKSTPKFFIEWAITNGWKKGLQIDRINNNGNYEPSNCRIVTARQNSSNRRSNSKYGVGIQKQCKKFHVRIRDKNGKRLCIGTYNTPEEAQRAYQAKLLEIITE